MFFKNFLKALGIISVLALFSCQKNAELGTAANPIKIYFTPSVDAESITSNSQDLINYLQKETGFYYKSGVPTSYIAVVEAFGSKRADIGVINSFGYLMANHRYGARALLRTIRYGQDYYQGQIITHIDNNINEIKQLNNKKFAFTDGSSTSGYMFPLKMLEDNEVKVSNKVFAGKHDSVVAMVYQKQVDAGATYYSAPTENGEIRDARARVKTQFPDIEEKVKILAITEKIPNDPFVFRKDLPEQITTKFVAAIKKYLNTEKGKEVFRNIYSVDGVVDSKDEDYDLLRNIIKSLNVDLGNIVK